jgi:hypothetical protein
MTFETDEGKAKLISLPGCREDVTAQEVGETMDAMIARPVFSISLAAKDGAKIVEQKTTVLF